MDIRGLPPTKGQHHSLTDTGSPKGYPILSGNRTVSKSAQSKIKNLAYTLSLPFRMLAKQIIQSRSHERSGFDPMTNIKSAVSSANPGKEMIVQLTGETVEVFDGCDSHTRQSLFGKIFG
jgi:hypothetical protein